MKDVTLFVLDGKEKVMYSIKGIKNGNSSTCKTNITGIGCN